MFGTHSTIRRSMRTTRLNYIEIDHMKSNISDYPHPDTCFIYFRAFMYNKVNIDIENIGGKETTIYAFSGHPFSAIHPKLVHW